MKIISVLNHKGGVGKTTFTGSTSQALALIGFRVLAVDNDSQHNLSSLLGVGVKYPGIRDVYTASNHNAPEQLVRSIRKTELNGLHIVTSCRDLCEADVADILSLKTALAACRLERFYDFILIDNGPGMDRLQGASVNASDELFVPTELCQFAIDGLVEMEQTLRQRYPQACPITYIIPNFVRNTKRHASFIAALHSLFPEKVTETTIPVDAVFDEVITSGKILFLHRLYSKGAAYYLKLVHELFQLDEDRMWEMVVEKRRERIRDEARARFFEKQGNEAPHEAV
ncbi:MAG: ParA family protein [Chitinispirillaceae bacterium]|nr:ParA family protein [Chitinispirillaceae bacterium]